MNRLRFRSGQVFLVKVPVDSNVRIEAGDLIWRSDDGHAMPASAFQGNDSEQILIAFASKYLGIAHQMSEPGDTTPISVDVSPLSVYEMDIRHHNCHVGDLLGGHFGFPYELSNQVLELTNDPAEAIGRAVEFRTSQHGTIRVSFASAFCTASANVHAQLGSRIGSLRRRETIPAA